MIAEAQTPRRPPRIAIAAAAGAIGLAGLTVVGFVLQGGAGGGRAPLPASVPKGSLVRAWSFSEGVPSDWTSLARTSLKGDELAVRSSATTRYQLYSPTFPLSPGTYKYTVTGRIILGTVSIAVVNTSAQRFVVARNYVGTPDDPARRLTLSQRFRLAKRTNIDLALSNGAPNTTGLWILQAAYVARVHDDATHTTTVTSAP